MSMSNDDDTMTVSTKAKKRMSVCLSVRPSVCHTCAAVRVRGADERQQTKYLLPVTRTLYSVPVRFSLQIQKICPVEGGGLSVATRMLLRMSA